MFRKCLASVPLALVMFAAPAWAQVKLELKSKAGDQDTNETTLSTQQSLKIAGMDLQTSVNQVIEIKTSVGERSAGGLTPVVVEFQKMISNMSLPGGIAVSFDSTNPGAKTGNPVTDMIADVFRALSGAKFTYLVSDEGKAVSVQGIDEVIAKVPAELADVMRLDLNAERMIREFEQEMKRLPENAVKKGDTWTRTEVNSIGSGQTFTFEKTYEYQGPIDRDGKQLDKIGVKYNSVSYAVPENAPSPLKVTGSNLKIDAAEGTILFDRERGAVVEHSNKVKIVGDLQTNINGMDLPATLDLTMEMKDVLKG